MKTSLSTMQIILVTLAVLLSADLYFTISTGSGQTSRGANFLQRQLEMEAKLDRILANQATFIDSRK